MTTPREVILDILERARWAPSGDNGQPWSFELLEGGGLQIHLVHCPDNVYEFQNGEPIWIAAGALIETISLVAATKGMSSRMIQLTDFGPDGKGSVVLQFEENRNGRSDGLEKYIEQRSVVRTAFQAKDIHSAQAEELQQMLEKQVSLKWFSSFADKWKIIRLNMMGTSIRFSIRETFATHQEVVDWKNELSPTGIPAKTLGVSPIFLGTVRWAMKSWKRMDFLMRYLGGTIIPRLEMDILPGLFCARHFIMTANADQNMNDPMTWIDVGRSVQRFWLCATKQQLYLQPGLAPVIFAKHAECKKPFTKDATARRRADELRLKLEAVSGASAQRIVFAGRIGFPREIGRKVTSRSIRKPLSDLVIHN